MSEARNLTLCGEGEWPVEVVDRMPAALRACVHDFGFSIVDAFVTKGITSANTIRHLVNAIYRGARETGNRPSQGPGKGSAAIIDEVLRVHGAPCIGRTIVVTLRHENLTILSREPSLQMIEASCAALEGAPTVTYERKHQIRLRAALKRGDRDRWGWLDQ